MTVRDASPADNAALLALAGACPMAGDMTLCVEREPDFFALNRLEGERWRVGVVPGNDESIVGCVAVTERLTYVHGSPVRTAYLSDLKVHPLHRGSGMADALSRYCVQAVRPLGDHAIALLTVLAGNRPMERRAAGPRGLPHLGRFATLQAHAVSLLWRRSVPTDVGVRVERATDRDLDEMIALWCRVAPGRQFAPVYDAQSLSCWIARAPGLDLSCFRLARRPDGRLAGFLALWDQFTFKQLRVLDYSGRMAAFRLGFNALAPLVGATRLPPRGAPLRHLVATHVCVPADAPGVLRALFIDAYNELRGREYAFFTVGLDERDPLAAALRGLWTQPTRVHAYVSTPAGRYAGPPLDDRPLHFEIALV